jgi:hypothetical protein
VVSDCRTRQFAIRGRSSASGPVFGVHLSLRDAGKLTLAEIAEPAALVSDHREVFNQYVQKRTKTPGFEPAGWFFAKSIENYLRNQADAVLSP